MNKISNFRHVNKRLQKKRFFFSCRHELNSCKKHRSHAHIAYRTFHTRIINKTLFNIVKRRRDNCLIKLGFFTSKIHFLVMRHRVLTVENIRYFILFNRPIIVQVVITINKRKIKSVTELHAIFLTKNYIFWFAIFTKNYQWKKFVISLYNFMKITVYMFVTLYTISTDFRVFHLQVRYIISSRIECSRAVVNCDYL